MKLYAFWELKKNNDIVNFYHMIPAQETKKTKQFTNLNRFIWGKDLFNQN